MHLRITARASALVLAIVALLATAVAPAAAIVGGVAATEPYPAVASLQTVNPVTGGDHHCGATVIAARWAVTNAHCVTEPPQHAVASTAASRAFAHTIATHAALARHESVESWQIRVGSADRTSGGRVVAVDAIYPHPDWAWGLLNAKGQVADIALLHLRAEVPGPYLFALFSQVGQEARLTGWGLTDETIDVLPIGLRQLDVRVVDPAVCAGAGIAASEICLGVPVGGGGGCYGDSGSPVLTRIAGPGWPTMAGSISRGLDGVACGASPAVATRTADFRKWIAATIALHDLREVPAA